MSKFEKMRGIGVSLVWVTGKEKFYKHNYFFIKQVAQDGHFPDPSFKIILPMCCPIEWCPITAWLSPENW